MNFDVMNASSSQVTVGGSGRLPSCAVGWLNLGRKVEWEAAISFLWTRSK